MNVNHCDFFKEQVPLGPYTTMGVGGPARYFYEPQTVEALQWCLQWAGDKDVAVLILGGGSNVLASDQGWAGLVLRLDLQGLIVLEEGPAPLVRVMAGVDWDELAEETVSRGWAGLECLSGIPGKCGAAPIQNIGAYGQDVSETIEKVGVLDLATLKPDELDNEACQFTYRHSIFKGRARGRYVITHVDFRLRADGVPTIRYPDLQNRLSPDATLQQVRDTVLQVRRGKSMVFDVEDPNSHGCGSFFTNPILDDAAYARFAEKAPGGHPHFPADDGGVKLSAAWLMDHAGFKKGYGDGPVGLSGNHCLAIVNRGGGTAADVLALVKEVQAGVRKAFGVELVPEPVILSEGGFGGH